MNVARNDNYTPIGNMAGTRSAEDGLPEKLSTLELTALDVNQATRVRFLLEACEGLRREPYITRKFTSTAADISARVSVLSPPWNRPVSPGTIKRLYYMWNKSRKWQTLVDMRCSAVNVRMARTAQQAFRSHLAVLAGKHPRSMAAAVRELKREWDEGKPIPGYDDLKRIPGKYPAGWSEDNLVRKMPKRSALKYACVTR